MKSLRLVGENDAAVVFNSIWNWREKSLSTARDPATLQQIIIESTFLDASVQLLEDKAYTCESVLGQWTEKMENTVFHWATRTEQLQIRSDMTQFKRNIENAIARIIGALSRGRLEAVSAILFKEMSVLLMKTDLSYRSAFISLCNAMKFIQLSFSTENDFAASLNLIQHSYPIKHAAAVKPSQARHCLSSMMSCWLHPMAESGVITLPPFSSDQNDGVVGTGTEITVSEGLRSEFFLQIDSMQENLRQWAEEKNKHISDVYPLIVDLWCLQNRRNFLERGDKVLKMLKKAIKTKEYRSLAVRCMTQCARTTLYRLGTSTETSERSKTSDWLNRIARDVVLSIRRTTNPPSELQDLMVRLCVTIGHTRALFMSDMMINPLMQHEQSDKVTIALRALLEMMFMAVAKTSSHSSSPSKDLPVIRDQLVSLERNDRELQLLEYIRSGKQALSLVKLEDRRKHFSTKLGKLLQSFETGAMIGASSVKSNVSLENTKEFFPVHTMRAWCLRCIPYIWPLEWQTTELIDTLAKYTCHVEGTIGAVAIRSLKHILIGIPNLRNDVLSGLAAFIVNIPDDNKSGIRDGLRNLHDLLLEWSSFVNDPMESGQASPSSVFKVQPLEGLVLSFFCSTCSDIRRLAIDILSTIRQLHKSLTKCQEGVNSVSCELGIAESPFGSVMYVMDVLEEMGSDIAQRIYWDFGPWSDLCRRWKPVPEDLTLLDVMCGTPDQNLTKVRWARCLSEIAIEAHGLCSEAFENAYVVVSKKIYLISNPESTGRSPIETADASVLEQFRNYCAFACGCPPFKKTDSGSIGIYSAQKLHQTLVSFLNGGWSAVQDIAVCCLGTCNPKSYDILAKEIQTIMTLDQVREKTRGKQTTKTKIEEVRLNTANVCRLIADRMPRGCLSCKKFLRQRLLEVIDSSLNYIRPLGQGPVFESISQLSTEYAVQDILQICYCLCSILANTAPELTGSSAPGMDGLNTKIRRILFETFQQWNAPGASSDEYIRSKAALLHSVVLRSKDVDSLRKYESELDKTCRFLEVVSRLGMVALLQGQPWEQDRRTNSPIFTWIDYLLTQEEPHNMIGPSNVSIARQALIKMIISNMSLFTGYVNKCYYANQKVASIYFQVVCEVYCSYEVHVAVHVILSLVLYKCVDPDLQVREDALHLLKCVAHREWQGKCTTGWALCFNGNSIEDNVVVMGNLQDTCQSFQYQLSESLAREHPEINAKLCEELLTMQCNEVVNQGVLLCLTPWMERLSFCPGDSEWGDRLLKSMYYITSQHGKHLSHEIERLWSTIANNKSNVRPILDFLVGFGFKECALQDPDLLLEYFSVLKRISVYLARTSPHRTIDHLVSEAGRMIQSVGPITIDGDKVEAESPLKFSSSFSSKASSRLRSQLSISSQREGPNSRPIEFNRTRPPSFTSASFVEAGLHHRDRTYPSNVSISMQSDGSFDEGFPLRGDSTGVLGQISRKSISNLSGLGSERRGSEVAIPSLKGQLQRADIALCLLSEIAFEQGDKFNDHVPLLFHLCVICMDNLEPVVRLHCQQLVIHLLNVLMSKRVGIPSKANKLSALMLALQSMKGQPPWPYEDTDLSEGQVLSEDDVSFFVSGLLEATCQGSNLKDLWIKEALTWAIESLSRHLSCRSFQVLRGLNPQASSEAFISLVRCLKECFTYPSITAMECILEILETMKMLMYNSEGTKLVLYPQLFWVCISLLSSDYVHIYRLALELLHRLLDSLSISNDIILNVLLATTPTSIQYSPVMFPSKGTLQSEESDSCKPKEIKAWDLGTQILLPLVKGKENPILCVQHLLIKGLYFYHTESITMKLLTRLSNELILTPEMNLNSSSYMTEPKPKTRENSGVSVLLGSVHIQLAVSLAAIIPWTCLKILSGTLQDEVLEVCHSLADACTSEGYNIVGSALIDVTTADNQGLSLSLIKLADALHEEIPCEVESLMIGYWLSFLKSKEQVKIHMSLMLLRAIFERYKNPSSLDVQYTCLCVLSDFSVFSLLSTHLQGLNSVEASKVLSAMVSCSSKLPQPHERDQEQTKVLSQAMELGMELDKLIPYDNEQIKKTIDGVLETCPQHLKKSNGREFMPFLKDQGQ